MAKISIIGNVGRDPEMRMTPSGRPVCDFSVAVIYVDGRFAPRTYVGRDGVEKTALEIACNDFVLMGRKADREEGPAASAAPQPQAAPFDPDEIPF